MTREEEVKQAAYSQYCNSESVCFTLMCDSFKQGAEWADENPKPGLIDLPQVWHNVSKRPEPKAWFIAQIGEKCFDTFIVEIDKNDTWAKWSKGINITRWVYIEDLLPKEGK